VSVVPTQATLSTLLPLFYITSFFIFNPSIDLPSVEPPKRRMFLTLTPTMPRTELGAVHPSESFAVDVALKQASKDHAAGLDIPPASNSSKSGITSAPNLRIRVDEISPAVKSDLPGTDNLSQADSVVDATPRNLKQHEAHSLSGADPLTKELNNHVDENTVCSSSAGFMDKVAPPPTVMEGAVEDIPASPATRLKRRLEDTKDLIVCPGVYDGLSARIALAVGCDAMYMVREPLAHWDRRADYHSDRCWDHRFSARHGRLRCGHTH